MSAQAMDDNVKSMSNVAKQFYFLAGLMVIIDLALMSGSVWVALRQTGSAMLVGAILFISTLVPLIAKKVSKALGSNQSNLSVTKLSLTRLIAAIFLFVMSFLSNTEFSIFFLLIAFTVGFVNFITQSGIEVLNARLGNLKFVDGKSSVKWVQLSVQLGAFAGAAVGGFLVESLAFGEFLFVLAVSSFLVTGSLQVSMSSKLVVEDPILKPRSREKLGMDSNFRSKISLPIILLVGVMAMVGGHVGSFNAFLPYLYQTVLSWTAVEFGLTSALAAVGALFAISLPLKKSLLLILSLMLVSADILLCITDMKWLSIGSGFVIGLSISYTRMMMRDQVLTSSLPQIDKEVLIGKMVMGMMVAMGSLPLIMGVVISQSPQPKIWGAVLFVSLAVVIFLLNAWKQLSVDHLSSDQGAVQYES